jgi:hypothetical protein
LSIALAIVALIALSAFGLVLVLARRLRTVTERVNLFLPFSVGTLPAPGTPVAEFEAETTDGQEVSHHDLAQGETIFALLTTGCGECLTEVSEFQKHGSSLSPMPVVGVIGPAEDRLPIVEALRGHARVLEEATLGPVASSFEINEFPAVLLIRDGYIQFAEHRLAPVLEHVSTASAGTRH